MFLYLPIIADPPLCTLADLRSWVTLEDLCDMHEILDLKAAAQAKAARSSKKQN